MESAQTRSPKVHSFGSLIQVSVCVTTLDELRRRAALRRRRGVFFGHVVHGAPLVLGSVTAKWTPWRAASQLPESSSHWPARFSAGISGIGRVQAFGCRLS